MDWIEVTARTVEDAKELALDRLGVVEDELEFEILDEAKPGLFGLRRGEARIRARVKPLSREKPVDRRRRRGSAHGDRPARSSRSGSGAPKERAKSSSSSGGNRSPKAPSNDESNGAGGGGSARQGSGKSSNRRRGGRGRSGQSRTPTTTPAAEQAETREAEVEIVDSVPVATQADDAAKFTEELVRTMGFAASVRTEIDNEDITVHIEGEGLGTLVGPKGVTLHALEEVVRAVVQHKAGGHSAWVHVDVGGYRQRRREALETFARKVADEVKASGEGRSLEPMSAADRKVVHDAIADVDGVATGSEGEEPRRRVVIRPA